jgi:hypothetical protein
LIYLEQEKEYEQSIAQVFALSTIEPKQNFEQILAQQINRLIDQDFQQLLFLLYKVDVDEKKLKRVLQEKKDENAGLLIAQLVIERQKQKLASKASFSPNVDEKTDEERW